MKKKATTKREAILADVGKTPEEHANELMEYQYRFEEEMKPIRDELYNAAHLFIVPDARLSTNGELEDIRRAHSMSRDNVVHGLRAFAHEQVLSYGRTRKASPIDDPFGEDITLAENAFKEHMITIANRFPDVSNRAVEISAEIGRFIQECYFNTDKNNQGPARDLEDIICKTNALFDALANPGKKSDDEKFTEAEIFVLKLAAHLYREKEFPNTRNKFKDADAIRKQRADIGKPFSKKPTQKEVLDAIYYFRDRKYHDILERRQTLPSWRTCFSHWYNDHKPRNA